MSIGYACLTVGVENTDMKSCVMKNASEERLIELIAHNLNSLENIIDYNISKDIKLFRISSDLIPFGSSHVNRLPWWDIFAPKLLNIGGKVLTSGMRVSMHPGQYTVLNSPSEEVVQRAMEDLNYHAKVLESLGVGEEHKIVLHIGGVYGSKEQAIMRFIINYQRLEEAVKRRLVIENDDKSYNICDVLEIGRRLNIPVVYDNLHNAINPCDSEKNDFYWIDECSKTWQEKDGCPKIHYAQQELSKKPGAHSSRIRIDEFMDFYQGIAHRSLDIMLEVKDKNLSAIKCINCTSPDKKIKALELEWSKYKYKILEKSQQDYIEIRSLLKDKKEYPAVAFYNIIDKALEKEDSLGSFINAAQHVWGYFKDRALDKEKDKFLTNIKLYQQGEISAGTIKNFLWKMAVKYKEPYLLYSYYFVL